METEAIDMVHDHSPWPELDLEEQSLSTGHTPTEESDSSPTERPWTDLEFSADTWKLLHGVPQDPLPGQVVAMRSYAAGAKKAVNGRGTDLLTPEDLQAESARVKEAMLNTLEAWANYDCFA